MEKIIVTEDHDTYNYTCPICKYSSCGNVCGWREKCPKCGTQFDKEDIETK